MRNPDQYRLDFEPPAPERPMPKKAAETSMSPHEKIPLRERAQREALELIHKNFRSENVEDLNLAYEETDEKDNLVSIVYMRPGTPFKPEQLFRVWFEEGKEGQVDRLTPEPKRGII